MRQYSVRAEAHRCAGKDHDGQCGLRLRAADSALTWQRSRLVELANRGPSPIAPGS